MSFTGLLGLVSGAPPFRTLLSAPSNAACCCSCAPPRCHPGPCRSHHHHPSPDRPQASISALLTRPFGRSRLVSAFSACPRVGLLRRLKRPLRPPGRPPGRQEQRWCWPQRGRRRTRRLGCPDGRWRPLTRPFGRLRRPSAAAAEQQQEQQQRRRRAQEGASGGLGGGYEACAAGEPRKPPAGVVGRRRDGFRRSLRCMPVCMKKGV